MGEPESFIGSREMLLGMLKLFAILRPHSLARPSVSLVIVVISFLVQSPYIHRKAIFRRIA